MILETLSYEIGTGWSAPFPGLDSDSTLVMVFGGADFIDRPEPVRELKSAFPRSLVVGCSTSGEIFHTEVRDDSLAVAVARFERTQIRSAFRPLGDRGASRAVGEALAGELAAPDLRAILVLSEGIRVNGSELVKGFNAVLPPEVSVTGGLAGDRARFQRTWIISDGEIRPSGVVGIGFFGSAVKVGHGSKGGWDIFGPEREVTRSADNVLYELDGEPALTLYKRYLGDRAEGLPATGLLFPLAIRQPGSDHQLVRTILSVNETDQSIIFAGNIPQGAKAQFMKANFDRLVVGAAEAAEMSGLDADGDQPHLAVAISCVGRRLVLGERSEEETEATMEALPAGTQQIGFYSYGELSPFTAGTCDLHNQTMTLTVITEE